MKLTETSEATRKLSKDSYGRLVCEQCVGKYGIKQNPVMRVFENSGFSCLLCGFKQGKSSKESL